MNPLEKTVFLIICSLAALASLRFPLLVGEKDSWHRKHLPLLLIAAWLVDALLFIVCFRESEAVWDYFATIVELSGVALLGAEVWFAQHMEEWRNLISMRRRVVEVAWNRGPAGVSDATGAIDYLREVNDILHEDDDEHLRKNINNWINAGKLVEKAEERQRDATPLLQLAEYQFASFPALKYRRRWLYTGLALLLGSIAFHATLTKIEPPLPKSLKISKFDQPIQFGTGVFALKVPLEASPRDAHDLQKDLTPVVCSAKDELDSAGTSLAIIIGRHDSMPMKRRAAISNLDIAQLRAEAVAAVLQDAHSCGSAAIPNVITLSRPPAVSSPVRARDREVSILGFGEALDNKTPAVKRE